MTDEYKRLRERAESALKAEREGLAAARPTVDADDLTALLDAYKEAVEALRGFHSAAASLKQADDIGMPLGGPLNALFDALEAEAKSAVLARAREIGVID